MFCTCARAATAKSSRADLFGQFVYNLHAAARVCESAAYLNNIANVASYTQSYGNANYTVDDAIWSLFIQDDFHLRKTSR